MRVNKNKKTEKKKKSKIQWGNDIPLNYQVFIQIYKLRKDNG